MNNRAAEKQAKVPITRGCINYFPRALMEVARVSVYGAKKHNAELNDKGFLRPEYTLDMYEDAITRHQVALAIEGEINEEDGGLYHRAQRAWNALASLEKFLIEEERKHAEFDLGNGLGTSTLADLTGCQCADCRRG
jgi:hypothetical protein